MKRMMIKETEMGFLFKRGKLIRLLDSGIHYALPGQEIRKVPLSEALHHRFDAMQLAVYRKNSDFAEKTTAITVPDGSLVLHYENDVYQESLPSGSYAFWKEPVAHRFEVYDITTPEVPAELPRYLCEKLCAEGRMLAIEISDACKGLLRFDNSIREVLDPGKYYFWKCPVSVSVAVADTRQQLMNVCGQEILTKDKVSIRLNFLCSYRITDLIKLLSEVQDYEAQLYSMAQMVLREVVSTATLDELLSDREELTHIINAWLREKASALCIDIKESGIRDIILPGEVRDIMNTVLIAEKRAQANVITRREEVASTRSLLNTAKMMEENPTLYKLKELEYLERVCENVGNISVSGGDLLAQLRAILGSSDTSALKGRAS